MKIKNLLLAGGAMLMLASCGTPTAKTLKDSGAKNTLDSVCYLLGEQYAGSYSQFESRDSALYNNDKARQAYMKGMMAALSTLKEGDEAYNEGYMAGIQLASNVLRTEKELPEFKFDKKLFGIGLAAGMDKKIEATPQASSIINDYMMSLYNAKQTKDAEAVKAAMSQYAKKNGMKSIAGGDAFIKVLKPGNGPAIAEGDSLSIVMDVKSNDGKDLSAYSQKETTAVMGKTLPAQHPYYQALLQMKSGEKALVLLPAAAVYGNYLPQMGLQPDNYLIIDMQATVLGK